jgi:hypothetical protein
MKYYMEVWYIKEIKINKILAWTWLRDFGAQSLWPLLPIPLNPRGLWRDVVTHRVQREQVQTTGLGNPPEAVIAPSLGCPPVKQMLVEYIDVWGQG